MGGTYGNKHRGMRTGCRVLVGKREEKGHPVDNNIKMDRKEI
jgi:hypothetical protein